MAGTGTETGITHTSRTGSVQISVTRKGEPYLNKVVARSPAVIGRDENAEICLEQGNVSRRHAEIQFDGDTVRVVDCGSKNGFKINGARKQEAIVGPEDRVTITDFELRIKRQWREDSEVDLTPIPDDELAEGWGEIVAGSHQGGKNTQVRAPVPGADASTRGRAPGARTADAHRPVIIAHVEDEEEDEESEAASSFVLLDTLENESNSLLYGKGDAAYGVEVVVSQGQIVNEMCLVRQGGTYTWGQSGAGTWLAWLENTAERAPVLVQAERAQVHVRVPFGGPWKIFHRGKVSVEPKRIGAYLTCAAEWGDQIQVTHGQLAFLVRWVRLPTPRERPPVQPWVHMTKSTTLALIWSLTIHALAIAAPIGRTRSMQLAANMAEQWNEWHPPRPHSAVQVVEFIAPAKSAVPPAKPPEPKLAHATKAATRAPEPASRNKPQRINLNTPAPDEPAPVAPTPPKPSAVSVTDFKVLGMIAGLPDVQIQAADGFRVGSGARMLRPGASTANGRDSGVVGKSTAGMRIAGNGNISAQDVNKVINRNRNDVGRCYAEARAEDSGLEGRLEVEWIIDKHGVAGTVRILQDDVGSPTLARCLREAIAAWRFPAPDNGLVYITIPLRFARPNL